MTIETDKCTECKACERGCKSSCINSKTKYIDYSRCVTCFNCIDKCKSGAINYTFAIGKKKNNAVSENAVINDENRSGVSRRNALSIIGLLAVGSTIKAQQLHVDGGLATIEDKKIPNRKTPIVPPDRKSVV